MRLKAEMQAGAEGGQERAVWDAATRRFVVATAGDGVKQFLLDDDYGTENFGDEARTVVNSRGTNNSWVWDYNDTAAAAPVGPQTPGSGTAVVGAGPATPTAQVLSAPTFSPPDGSEHPLTSFNPLNVRLVDPNPPGVSQMWYHTGGGTFVRYTGGDIPVTSPTQSIITDGSHHRSRSLEQQRQ